MSFNPRLKSNRCEATIKAGELITSGLMRFRVEATTENGLKEAISKQFGGNVAIVEEALFQTDKDSFSGNITVEGFAVVRPQAFHMEGDKTTALSNLEAEHNVRLSHVAANIYMDEDENPWEMKEVGGNTVVTRNSVDDVIDLITTASAKSNKLADSSFKPAMSNQQRGIIAYVDQNGDITKGIAYASVQNDDNRIQVMLEDDHDNDVPEIVDVKQVIAFSEWDEEDRDEMMDPLEYYRKLYNNDPNIMDILETLV